VGADGKMVGFGGGVWRKKILLELEARVRIEREFGL
jgi:methylated-DNA-[protein]-cysteine S-methyltransferase